MGQINFPTALFAAIAFLLSSFGLSGQQYLNETARWEQYTSYYQNPTNNSYCSIAFFMEGDTVANSITYYRLMRQSECRFINPSVDSLGNSIIDTSYSNQTAFDRFIREADRKFYYYYPATNTENWFYNFNIFEPVPIGDAVSEGAGCGTPPQIIGHDTVCIGSIGRKRWSLEQGVGAVQYFIEGIGPSSGLFGGICNTFCPECGAGLTRFMLNGDTLYSGSCSIPSGIIEQTANQVPIRAILHSGVLSFDASDIEAISLYSATGKMITRTERSKSSQIAIDGYTPGIYIYNIATLRGNASGKIYIPAY